MIIGITGTLGAGKGTVVEYLKQHGFVHYSAREFIVREIKSRGLSINRDTMTLVANDLRREHGPGYIIESLYKEALQQGGDAVIESIRAEGEVMAMKQKSDFYLFAVDADPEIRYQRIVLRASETDAVPFEKFMADEQREIDATDPSKGNLLRCIELADYTFTNNGSIEELNTQIEAALKAIRARI